jgi:hypothetical protein
MKNQASQFLNVASKGCNGNRSSGKGKWSTYTFRIRLECSDQRVCSLETTDCEIVPI